ncbi:MAG: hypothetical protein WC726_01640 [Parcubacteria group bacterium]|jgi:hypothetical protein
MSGKKISIFLIVLILIVAGFLMYRSQKNKKNQNVQSSATQSSLNDSATGENSASDSASAVDANLDQADQDFDAQCTSGEWVKIADVAGDMTTIQGTVQSVDPEDDATKAFKSYRNYIDNGKEKIGLVDPNVKSEEDDSNLDFFQTREVEVQGVLGQGVAKEMKVSQIRCAGKETDKSASDNRAKILNYISANISSIAPEKAPKQKWVASSVIVLDEKDFYVDYYDTIEDDENSDLELDTTHRVLLEMNSGENGKFNAKVLAYWVPGEEDFMLKQGKDKFENIDETTLPSYSYDSDDNSWSRD